MYRRYHLATAPLSPRSVAIRLGILQGTSICCLLEDPPTPSPQASSHPSTCACDFRYHRRPFFNMLSISPRHFQWESCRMTAVPLSSSRWNSLPSTIGCTWKHGTSHRFRWAGTHYEHPSLSWYSGRRCGSKISSTYCVNLRHSLSLEFLHSSEPLGKTCTNLVDLLLTKPGRTKESSDPQHMFVTSCVLEDLYLFLIWLLLWVIGCEPEDELHP